MADWRICHASRRGRKEADGGAFTSAAHKAYLAVPADVAMGANSFTLEGAIEETTAIQAVETTLDSRQPIYTLSGQRMTGTHLPKGIYIQGGRKFVVK